jgi:putative transposase
LPRNGTPRVSAGAPGWPSDQAISRLAIVKAIRPGSKRARDQRRYLRAVLADPVIGSLRADRRRAGPCHVGGRLLGGWGVSTAAPSYKGHRYPVEIIAHCVWLYHRFPLSFREAEELMLARGVVVSYETIRRWCGKFGQAYANALRRRRPRPGDKWHLDEVFIRINGVQHYLWRAVDQHGNVLDILVQSRRNAKAAKKFFRKLLKGLRYVPRVIITDKLGSYQAAHRATLSSVEHRRSKYLNNRAENSHQPTRAQERSMRGFHSPGGAQRFLSAFSGISPHFRPRRHRLPATGYRATMSGRFSVWNEITGQASAA